MGSIKSLSSRSHSRPKRFLICILLVSLPFSVFIVSEKHKRMMNKTTEVDPKPRPTTWFDVIAKGLNKKKKVKVGVVNIDAREELLSSHEAEMESVVVDFDHVDGSLKWEEIFPAWIDEDGKWSEAKCPNIPMPKFENFEDLNVVVAKVPCGVRDVFRLQVNLVVANLAVRSGWLNKMEKHHRNVYVVFVGSCGPMEEIFSCDNLLTHEPEFRVYKPDLWSLKQKTLMPVGSCQIASGYAKTGKEVWRNFLSVPKVAYVSVLHSSEAYVCGAIALAQSILQSNTNFPNDLLLLVDKSIAPKSITALKAAGWKIQRIKRITSPFAKPGAYNKWNYSKLRIWQLTTYDKIIFLDSDLVLLNNLDHLFVYPQLTAAPNNKFLFNSGLMVIEPSQCMFENMMNKTLKVRSYNGGDQGFLNEIFTWWHRLPRKVNLLKSFQDDEDAKREVPEDVYAVHYLGLKPWMCYRDYDCNWDMQDRRVFASDSAHKRWWQVYDAMPEKLQSYCGLTQKMNERIVKWRRIARNSSFSDGHWKIKVEDPRKGSYHSD
ncbi:putative UDP-glucuronate:xylan alpha-glucuronosyltransferase 4 [Vigna unguiculata]|uniref:putative UDP-glucuronate:xylan alpha-glucuronosyltransferase 4 n=1 Tax=Vigna unguiculata TaxID=3917 RepID=UPI00101691BB|nr:putative UDP-glucuronate:xylan alpha-glucuronosyltransferase 4 [Vigna unguiculata]